VKCQSRTTEAIAPEVDALLASIELVQYARHPRSRQLVRNALRETGQIEEPQPLTRELLVEVCGIYVGDSIKDGIETAAAYCSKVREAIAGHDANGAAYSGFMLGMLTMMTMLGPITAREARRLLGNLTSHESNRKQAAENRDRVNALVKRKGMKPSEAMKKVAEERGVGLRTIQRHCKKERHV
jgi:hypothetical protein